MTAFPSGWSAGRRNAAACFLVLLAAAMVIAASYVAGALFLLINRADPRQAAVWSILAYWQAYASDGRHRKQLIGSIAVPTAVFVVGVPASLAMARSRRRPLHGSARFANWSEVVGAGLLRPPSGEPGVIVGRYRGRYLMLRGQLSVMLSAPTRSGKGVGIVIPNLLAWPDSVVVLDIKGENFALTAGYRAACGQAVYAFSPFDDEARSHRWNPLSTVRTSRLHRVGDLLAIGQVFFPNEGTATSSEAFFNDQARNVFMGLGLLLLETPDLPRTIGEMLRQSSGKGRALRDHLAGTIADRAAARRPLSDECVDALQRLIINSDNTLSSIVSTFNAPLTLFADAVVDAATSADDFRLEDVRKRPMSIYVRVPPNRLASAKPLLSLFFSQLVSLNTRSLSEHDTSLKVRCLLVNDEFTAMGRVGIISTAAAFLAGYNLRLLTVVQAMSQLDALYGEKEGRTFATNHGLQILYAPREQRDADEYSAMLGHFTERATSRGRSRSFGGHHNHHSVSRNDSDQKRALLLPQEFKELGSERQVIVMENCRPILADKIRYYRESPFIERLRPAPDVPAIDMDLHFARAEQRWSLLPDELPTGAVIDLARLAHDFDALPDLDESSGPSEVRAFVDAFLEHTLISRGARGGGQIEQVVADEAPDVGDAEHAVEPIHESNL